MEFIIIFLVNRYFHVVMLITKAAVRVKGGMSLRNGMWKDVRNGIIMQNKNCGMT